MTFEDDFKKLCKDRPQLMEHYFHNFPINKLLDYKKDLILKHKQKVKDAEHWLRILPEYVLKGYRRVGL